MKDKMVTETSRSSISKNEHYASPSFYEEQSDEKDTTNSKKKSVTIYDSNLNQKLIVNESKKLKSTRKNICSAIEENEHSIGSSLGDIELNILPTFEDVIKVKQKSVFFNICYSLVLSSGGYFFGFYEEIFNNLGVTNPYLSFKETEENKFRRVSDFNQFANMLFTFGCALGLIISGIMINKIGRLKMIICNEILIL